MHPLVAALLDGPGLELHPKWAPNIVTTLGRLGGRTVGVIANNPLRLGGCLDSASAEKAARFVRMCDAFGVPLVVLVDVPGYLPGVGQEWDGVVRRGAKLLHAFAEAVVPRVTLVTRKAYGGAYIAMNSRSLGATTVFAWPGAEVAVMGAGPPSASCTARSSPPPRRGEREALHASWPPSTSGSPAASTGRWRSASSTRSSSRRRPGAGWSPPSPRRRPAAARTATSRCSGGSSARRRPATAMGAGSRGCTTAPPRPGCAGPSVRPKVRPASQATRPSGRRFPDDARTTVSGYDDPAGTAGVSWSNRDLRRPGAAR